MKTGLKTTELWLTVVQVAAGLVVAFAASKGLVAEDDAEKAVAALVTIGGLVIGALVTGRYTKSRTYLKESIDAKE